MSKWTGLIEIRSMRDGNVCAECVALDGKQLSLDEALRLMPVHDADDERGACRCWYFNTESPWADVFRKLDVSGHSGLK